MNNAETIHAIRAAALENIRALMGDDSPETAGRARSIRNAAETGKNCARCGHEFEPDEAVWRFSVYLGRSHFGGWIYRLAPHCEKCRSKWDSYHRARPCAGCLRDVHYEDTGEPLRRETYCSEACRLRFAPALARWRRKAKRGFRRVCIECGGTFDPAQDQAHCNDPRTTRGDAHRA